MVVPSNAIQRRDAPIHEALVNTPGLEILAVDDNPNNLGSLEALLADLSVRVVKAHSGEEALRYLLDHEVAVILLDIQMPGLDGYDTAALIRGRDRTRHIPIIFVTAHSADQTKVMRGYGLGAVDFLFKPIVGEILKAKVSVFLDLSLKTQQVERNSKVQRESERRDHERALTETRREFEREKQRRVTDALGVLSDAANELLVGTRDRALLDRLHGRLATHLRLEVFMEHRVDETGSRLQLTSSSGLPDDDLAAFAELTVGDGVHGVVAATRRNVVLQDLQASSSSADAARARAIGLSAIACFPLVADGNLLGTLGFATRRARVLSVDDVKMMQGYCDQVGAALERDRLIAELKERDRRKDEFLAMLSHEFRNPLAPVRFAIELMRMPDAPPPMVERALAAADRQVTHMTRMLDDLLDVSRITNGKVELRRAHVTLQSVVEQAMQTTEKFVRDRGQVLKVSLPAEPVTLNADATRLVQVFSNLLHNASKYTEKGGHIALVAVLSGDGLVVQIVDDGIGIRPELLPRVFDLFVQAEASSDRPQGGLGLGLTLVQRLVAMHGGTVSAHSRGLGHGSEFTVMLPLATVEARPASLDVVARRLTLRDIPPLHVLLIEDEVDIREILKDLLELYGHRVDEAPDGTRGFERLMATNPQVALIDIGLPGLDGYALAKSIRAAPGGGAQTRLIAMTGYGGAGDRERALRAGFDAHIVKPVATDELATLLQQLCSPKGEPCPPQLPRPRTTTSTSAP